MTDGQEEIRLAYASQYKYEYGQRYVFYVIYGYQGDEIKLNDLPLTHCLMVCSLYNKDKNYETIIDLLLAGF